MTPPVSLGCGCWGVDERRVAPPGPTPPGPTGTHRHPRPDTREGSSHGPLEWTWSQEGLAPRMRTGRPRAKKTSVRGCKLRCWNLPGTSRTPLMTSSKTPPACSTPSTSSSSPATLSMKYVVASSKTRPDTADAQAIPSTKSGFVCAPRTRTLTPRQQERLSEAFVADEAHISVEVAYHCAQQV